MPPRKHTYNAPGKVVMPRLKDLRRTSKRASVDKKDVKIKLKPKLTPEQIQEKAAHLAKERAAKRAVMAHLEKHPQNALFYYTHPKTKACRAIMITQHSPTALSFVYFDAETPEDQLTEFGVLGLPTACTHLEPVEV